MAHLETKSGHTRICRPDSQSDCFRYMKYGNGKKGIKRYLEKNARSLATDIINMPFLEEGGNWGEEMDAMREMTCPERSYSQEAQRKPRTYYHFILSPDPDDDIALDKLRELATTWANEMFNLDDPKIGAAQVAIEYHDDNTKEIMHAHIIVNNVDLVRGGRLHINSGQYKMLTTRVQELCWERGFRAFDERGVSRLANEKADERKPRKFDVAPPSRETMVEQKRRDDERPSWKQEIKNSIEVACQMSDSPEQVVMHLAQMGIVAKPRTAKRVRPGEDFIFYYPQAGVPLEQNKKRVSGERLGKRYTAAGMRAQITGSYYRKLYAEDKDAVALLDMLVDVRDIEVQRGQTLADLAAAFAAINNFQITNMQDAQRHLAVLQERVKRELAAGNPVRMESDQIKQLEALIRIGPASNIVPLLREQSRTAQAVNPIDAAYKRRREQGEKIPLVEKVARGYRLTKEEYEQLQRDPASFREWRTNRRLAAKGRKPAGSASSPRGSGASSSGRSQTGGRTRGASRPRGE